MQQPMSGTPPWERPLASLPQRFFGQLIDGAVALGLAVGVVVLTPLDNIVAPYLVFIAYVLFADGLPGGQSLGKKLLGVEVIDHRTGRSCNWGQSFLRNFLLMILGPIDWLFIFGARHQRLGDRAADTVVVVSAPRGWQATGWNAPGAAPWTPPGSTPWAPTPPATPPWPQQPLPAAPSAAPPQTWMPSARPAQEPKVSYSSQQHAEPQRPPAADAPPPAAFDPNDNPLAPRDPKPPAKGEDWMPF